MNRNNKIILKSGKEVEITINGYGHETFEQTMERYYDGDNNLKEIVGIASYDKNEDAIVSEYFTIEEVEEMIELSDKLKDIVKEIKEQKLKYIK